MSSASAPVASSVSPTIPASIPYRDGELVSLPTDFSPLDQFFLSDLMQTCGLQLPSSSTSSSTPVLSQWKALGAQDGFLVTYTKPQSGEDLNRYKVTAKLPIDLERVKLLLRDVNNLKIINPQMVNVEVVKQIDADHLIVKVELKLPTNVISNRELLLLMSFHDIKLAGHEDAFAVSMNSINCSPFSSSLNPECVRAKLIRSGYVIESLKGETGVQFTSVFEADLEGWMPKGLQNFAAVHGITAGIKGLASAKEEKLQQEKEKKKEANPDYSAISNKNVDYAGTIRKEELAAGGSVGGSVGGNREPSTKDSNVVLGRPM